MSLDSSSRIFVQRVTQEMGIVVLRKSCFKMGEKTACLHAHENDSVEKEKLVLLERKSIKFSAQGRDIALI